MSRGARVIKAGAMFAYFAAGGALMSWVALPLATRGLARDDAQRRARALCARGFARFHDHLRAMDLVDFDPTRADLGGERAPCVYVANHPTLIDTPALGASLPQVCFVARRDFYRSPLFGPLLRACGHIDAGEGATLAGAAVVRDALEQLRSGTSLLIFPEGSRSPPGGMRRMRRGAFEIACRAGVPVVPLFIACDPPILHHAAPWHELPPTAARYTVDAMPQVDPSEFGGDARALARRVEAMYRDRLAALNEKRHRHARA
ncbi:MAG: lysophospholipid acyltransferase family protein [Polyangiales bacterium]